MGEADVQLGSEVWQGRHDEAEAERPAQVVAQLARFDGARLRDRGADGGERVAKDPRRDLCRERKLRVDGGAAERFRAD